MSSSFSGFLAIFKSPNLEIELENPEFLREINDTRDTLQKNILHVLTEDQSVEVLRCLLDKVDKRLINEKSANGQTPLCFGLTAKPTSEEFFLELISHLGCDITIADKRHLTPLHYAVFHGEYRIARTLLQRGANINARSITGLTPLYLAVENNDYEMVCMLLYYNADVNIECEENNPSSRAITSPLLHCIDRHFIPVAELLLDYIVDVNEPFSNGLTLLYHAIRHASQLTFHLIDRGADINHVYNDKYCIMAVRKIPGAQKRKEFFDHLWPLIDLASMIEYCPFDLYELFFKYNLLSDDYFASVFVEYDVEDTIHFANFIMVCREDERVCRGIELVRSMNRTEESLLGIFCSMLLVCDQIAGYLLSTIIDYFGFGRLFWTFVYFNVEIVDYTNTILYEFKLAMFVFDVNYFGELVDPFWRHYFALKDMKMAESNEMLHVEFPSLKELARTAVRRSCRRVEDLHSRRLFAFINRIKSLRLFKVCEDVLLLRKPIYHF